MDDMYEDEILCLKGEISEKDMEIEGLKYSLQNAKDNIKKLEIALLDSSQDFTANSEKKSRNISDEAKKRYVFYNKHKNDPDIIGPLKEKFSVIGIKNIPWYCIKDSTDELYYLLNASSSS
jgi:hypothetical protein